MAAPARTTRHHHVRVDWPLLLAFVAILTVLATFPPSLPVSSAACCALVLSITAEVRKRRSR